MSLQDEVIKLEKQMELRAELGKAELERSWAAYDKATKELAELEKRNALASDPQKPVDPLPKDEHAEGCRCPECDPAFNDPSLDEDGNETSDHYWRRQLGEIARRYAWTPDPKRSK